MLSIQHPVRIRVWLIFLSLFHPCLVRGAAPSFDDFTTALQYLNFGKSGQARRIASDAAGNLVVVATVSDDQLYAYGSGTQTGKIGVMKLDRGGRVLFRFTFGSSGYNEPGGVVVDPHGNIYIFGISYPAAGKLSSIDFPLVNPLLPNAAGPVFLAKVDPTGSRLLFSTFLGGLHASARVGGLTLDSQGDVYVTGSTTVSDFPVTPGAFQDNKSFTPRQGANAAFVMKISSAGDRVIYSTLLGGPRLIHSGAGSIAVDSSGQVTVAGATADRDFPVTPGAVQTVCGCGVLPPPFNTLEPQVFTSGFVARLNATGTALLWSTYLGSSGAFFDGLVIGADFVSALALDNAGNVFVTGRTGWFDFPTTPGVLEPKAPQRSQITYLGVEMAYAAKMNPSGTALIYSTYLAGTGQDIANGIAIDAQGHAWITGTTTSPDFPSLPGNLSLGNAFLLELETDASRLLRSYHVPAGSAGQALAMISPTEIATLGLTGTLTRWSFDIPSAPSMLAVANAAATIANGHVAPGEIVSLYGVGLGPTPGIGAQLDSNGRVATSLAGAQVLFDGKPAPMLYVSDTQVNCIVPFGLSGKDSTTVQVMLSSGPLAPLNLIVTAAEPGIFRTADGGAAALNEDGTINSPQNPAKRGSIVTIFLNGAGLLDPLPEDGSITGSVLAKPVLPVSVGYETLYVGAAPALVAGVLQLNVRLPGPDAGGPPNLALGIVVGGIYRDQSPNAPVVYTTAK